MADEHSCDEFSQGIGDSLTEIAIDIISHYVDDHGPNLSEEAKELIKHKGADSLVRIWVSGMEQVLDAVVALQDLMAEILNAAIVVFALEAKETTDFIEKFLRQSQ